MIKREIEGTGKGLMIYRIFSEFPNPNKLYELPWLPLSKEYRVNTSKTAGTHTFCPGHCKHSREIVK